MTRKHVAILGACALVAGMVTAISVPASAASAVCPTLPSTTAFSQATGVVKDGSGPIEGAAVYAVDSESGQMTCVLTDGTGKYTIGLPAVITSGSPRKPAESWLVIANPESASSLGSASKVLASQAVSASSLINVPDLELKASNLQARVIVEGTAAPVEGPAVVCLVSARTLDTVASCAVTQSYGGNFRAQLSVPATGRYWLQGAYALPSGWYEGYVDDPLISSGSPSAVDVTVAPLGSAPCPAGQPAITGTVTKSSGGSTLPARSTISVFAQWSGGFSGVGWTDTGRNGDYQLCLWPDELPPGTSLANATLFALVQPFSGGVTSAFPLIGCASGCSRNYSVSGAPTVSGRVLANGSPVARSQWTLATAVVTAQGPEPRQTVAFGTTDAEGKWGMAFDGLPAGTYIVQASPPVGSRGVTSGRQVVTLPAGVPVDITLAPGNLVMRVTTPSGDPAPWSWVNARKCTSNAGCEFTYGETDDEGYATLGLSNGTWNLTANPPWDSTGLVQAPAQAVVNNGVVTTWNGSAVVDPPTIQLRQPNVVIKAQRQVGGVDTAVPYSELEFVPWSGTNPNDPWDWNSATYASADDSGLARLWLDGGGTVYRLQMRPPNSIAAPALAAFVEAQGSGANVTLSFCVAPANWQTKPCQSGTKTPLVQVDDTWILNFESPNLAGTVVDPNNVPQAYANILIETMQTDPNGFSGYRQVQGANGWANSNEDGAYALRLAAAAPNSDDTVDYRLTVQKPWNSSGDWAAKQHFFTVDNEGNVCKRVSQATSCTPTGPLTSTNLDLARPNVAGTIRQSNGNVLSGAAYISVSRAVSCPGGGTGCRYYVTGTEVARDGTFSLSLASSDDTYYLQVYPWEVTDGSVQTTFELKVAPNQQYTGADALQLTLRGSNVTGVVRTASGDAAPRSWISVEQRVAPGQWQWVEAGTTTGTDGRFGMYLPPGNYRLRVEPGPSLRGQATATIVPSGDDTYFTVADAGSTNLTITLPPPNVSGEVSLPVGAGSGPAVNAWIEVQQWRPDYERYEWSSAVSGTSTGENGSYALNLPDGRWQILANPPWGTTGASRNQLRVVVTNGIVCLDNGAGACSGGPLSPGSADIQLRSPNVSGQVLFPNGNPAGNTWIQVRIWNASRGEFEWSNDIQGMNVDGLGRYSANLPDGRYLLIAEPPYGSTTASRGSVEIVVSSVVTSVNGTSCLVGGCTSVPLSLSAPNVSGRVKTPASEGVAFTNVQVQKWNSTYDYWEWQDIWANTSANGTYAVNLTNAGSYRLVARPTAQTADFAPGSRYVFVESRSDLCAVATETDARSATACSSTNDDSLPNLDVTLATANLPGLVRDDASSAVADAWVALLRKVDFGYEWVEGVNSRVTGGFAFDAPSGTPPTEYRLEVNPPWGNAQGLTRRFVDVVAYQDGVDTKVCPKAQWTAGSPGTCSAPVATNAPLIVTLSAGNLRGIVATPQGAGVRDTNVSVERWVEEPWNPGSGRYTWEWTDKYANTIAGGGFSVNLDDSGFYRVTGYPAWNDSSGYARGTMVVHFDSTTGKWCEVNDTTGTSANPFGACLNGYSDASSRLEVRLRNANITTRVLTPAGVGVRDAWVGVRKKVTSGGSEYWQWLSGSSTRASGTFATWIAEPGVYALEVNPPWQGGESLPRFSREFTVTCSASPCTSDLPSTINYPTPNFTGQVVSPNDATLGIRNSWVSVEERIDDATYRWLDLGSSTNALGNFVMNLPAGKTYRVWVNPSWENPVGTRTNVTVTVNGSGVATCTAGCLAGNRIQLQAPNLTGRVVDGGTAMKFSWVEVRDSQGNWIEGVSTDANGNFALSVPGGSTYTLWAYPNWNLSKKPPKSVSVAVPASGAINLPPIDLGAVNPNVTLTIANLAGPYLVAVEQQSGADPNFTYTALPNFTTTSSGTLNDNKALFVLPDGTYRLTVVPSVGNRVTSSAGSNTALVDVQSSGSVSTSVTFTEGPALLP